ncbi:hypothetical protein AVANS_1695 [Campylobacter sp. RM5004]|uniref:Cj0814 family flagellar-dependent secreted protein n=1 Tax=Campylobacter sp. RM5004 TaxID=1660078 RepID=UPI001EFB16F6|nr:hypothetical protein [Campylobacter sp. RM5004]ULO02300.1 hypothetical protein AVANS_1695 [Campylobacter sp. RM5004]
MRVESISIFDEAKLQKAQKAAGVSFSSIFASEFARVNPKLETQAEYSLDKDIIDASNIFIDRFNDSRFKVFDNDLTKINASISKQNELMKARVFNSTEFGYSVDSSGFLGADFNKAANLPDDFKIHSSTLKEISRQSNLMTMPQVGIFNNIYENIDYADTIKHQFRLYEQIVGDVNNFSKDDISNMPNYVDLIGLKINNGYTFDYSQANVGNKYYESKDDALKIGFKFDYDLSVNNSRKLNFDLSPYIKDGEISNAGLFVSFLGGTQGLKVSDSGATKIKDEYKERMLIEDALSKLDPKEGIDISKLEFLTGLSKEKIQDYLDRFEDEKKLSKKVKELSQSLAVDALLNNNYSNDFRTSAKDFYKRVQI